MVGIYVYLNDSCSVPQASVLIEQALQKYPDFPKVQRMTAKPDDFMCTCFIHGVLYVLTQ